MLKEKNEIPSGTFIFIDKIKRFMLWIGKSVELNETYFNQRPEDKGRPYVKKGEIYYADFGINIGMEIENYRPVLVFQNDDRYLRQSNLVFVMPLSTNIKPGNYKVHVGVEDVLDNDGIYESSIFIQQAKSISKTRLSEYCGRLSDEKLKEVTKELNRFLGNENPLAKEGDAQAAHIGAAKIML